MGDDPGDGREEQPFKVVLQKGKIKSYLLAKNVANQLKFIVI